MFNQSNTDQTRRMYDVTMPNRVDDMTEQILRNHYPLHLACRDADEERVKALLQSGCDVYQEDGLRGWTPMHWAAAAGSLKCLMVLSEHGVSIDAANHRVNQTPAHIAAEHNRLHCLHWLVTRGAATARQDNMGDTPLHKAVRNGNLECVALLIPHGPAISLENHSGQTPLDVARISQQAECAAHLQRAMASQQTGIGLPMSSPGVNQHVSSSATLVPNSSPDILMNGEPIYINQGGEAMVATGTEQVMETEDVMESCVSSMVVPAHTAGVKRSLDDGDDSNFKRQRCFEPSVMEKMGTSTNNNVLSSYNAVLAMSAEPVKGTNFQHHAESPVHVSLQPSPISYKPGLPPDRVDTPYVGTSSMLEHCHSLQAQYGYDSSFINSVVTTNHGS